MRFAFLTLCLFLTAPVGAYANPSYVAEHVPQAQKVGEGRLNLLFWDLYDAALYAPNGQWQKDAPYALELKYLRSFKGKDIVNATIDEFVRMDIHNPDLLNPWKDALLPLIPDVDTGDSIIGIRTANGHTRFYHNGTHTGTVTDPRFADHFFDIWLSKQTRSLYLRNQLLGKAK